MNETLIVKVIFGSYLYGTATATSDKDYKGVFLPSLGQLILGKLSKSINTSIKKENNIKNSLNDIDMEIYSLHYFIELACKGETVVLDMLHVPQEMVLTTSPIWEFLVKERARFYTKNLKAFIGYIKNQAAKYGIKGSRLSDSKNVIECLKKFSSGLRLITIWDELPVGEHIFKYPTDVHGRKVYEVCGKKVQETTTIGYALNVFEGFYKNYGERAKQAMNNENIDWKAVSHAVRVAYQVREILTGNNITFPLREADYLVKVKTGQLDYQKEVIPRLEILISEIEELNRKSTLPDKVDRNFWDKFIIDIYEEKYGIYIL